MSDSTDSELEIVNPSPVRAHTKYSVAQKTKEKRKRDHSFVFNRRRNTCQATTKCGSAISFVFFTLWGKTPPIFRLCWSKWVQKATSAQSSWNKVDLVLEGWNHQHYERNFYNWRKKAIQGTCNGVFSESQCEVWKVFWWRVRFAPSP